MPVALSLLSPPNSCLNLIKREERGRGGESGRGSQEVATRGHSTLHTHTHTHTTCPVLWSAVLWRLLWLICGWGGPYRAHQSGAVHGTGDGCLIIINSTIQGEERRGEKRKRTLNSVFLCDTMSHSTRMRYEDVLQITCWTGTNLVQSHIIRVSWYYAMNTWYADLCSQQFQVVELTLLLRDMHTTWKDATITPKLIQNDKRMDQCVG